MAPSCHAYVACRERNVSPTLERSSKQRSKGRSCYFRTARSYTKQSTKIYRCKSSRPTPRKPNYPMRATLDLIKPFLRRIAGGRKSIRSDRDRNLEDIYTEKERDFQDCDTDDSESKSEYFRKCTDGWDNSAGRSSLRKVKKPATPNLSDVQRSNFRMRLYLQLNVVKRKNETPSYLYSSSSERSNLKTLSLERSKPIAIHARRFSDFHYGSSDSKFREGKTSQSDRESDNEDVFVLDIGPISSSYI